MGRRTVLTQWWVWLLVLAAAIGYVSHVTATTATVALWDIPTSDSVPGGIVVDPTSGDIYFAETGGNRIGKLDAGNGTITEWSVGQAPVRIALDCSIGNLSLLFTERESNRIAMLTPATNAYRSVSVPSSGSGPTGILVTMIGMTLVPSDIWFTELWGNALGRLSLTGTPFGTPSAITPVTRRVSPATQVVPVTTKTLSPTTTATWGTPPLPPPIYSSPGKSSGAFTEWDLSSGAIHPGSIALDASNHLWVATGTASVLQFFPASNSLMFHGLSKDSSCLDVAIGPDGSVWITEGYKDKIGRLDPTTGVLTEWSLENGSQPHSLLVDPQSGLVWFTERELDRLACLDPRNHRLTEYQLPSGSSPVFITMDTTTGVTTILFSAERSNQIGALPLTALGPAPTLFDAITHSEIQRASLDPKRIDASVGQSGAIRAGTILLYRTSEGRYGKLEVQSIGVDLVLRWVTYASDGSVHSHGRDLVVRGSYECDLDFGTEGGSAPDFWWQLVTSSERYLQPENGAEFAVYTGAP